MICFVMSLPRATSYSCTKKQSTIEYIFRRIGDNRVLNILLKALAIPVIVGSSQKMLFNSNEWAATTSLELEQIGAQNGCRKNDDGLILNAYCPWNFPGYLTC
jgi:hypothetical protein